MLRKLGSPEPIDTEQDSEQRKTAAKSWSETDSKALSVELKDDSEHPQKRGDQ
jgi:hypothetical protein